MQHLAFLYFGFLYGMVYRGFNWDLLSEVRKMGYSLRLAWDGGGASFCNYRFWDEPRMPRGVGTGGGYRLTGEGYRLRSFSRRDE